MSQIPAVRVCVDPAALGVSADPSAAGVSLGTQVVKEYVDADPYEGPVTVTPSEETQVLATAGLRMLEDVTVNPIPSNYGRISRDGSILTVQ